MHGYGAGDSGADQRAKCKLRVPGLPGKDGGLPRRLRKSFGEWRPLGTHADFLTCLASSARIQLLLSGNRFTSEPLGYEPEEIGYVIDSAARVADSAGFLPSYLLIPFGISE